MLYHDSGILNALNSKSLPASINDIFGDLFDETTARFVLQETSTIDFKQDVPTDYSSGYGAGIIRLAIGFHNTFGGLIVFGVSDETLSVVGTSHRLDSDFFNRALSDCTGRPIECLARSYDVATQNGPAHVHVVLVPARESERPARLVQALDRYPVGTLWVRERHEVLEAKSRHLPLLFSDRRDLLVSQEESIAGIHKSMPPSPATMEEFIGRATLLSALWEWLVFGTQPRMYLHGPGGSGKSTLAYEFAKAVADAPAKVKLRGGAPLDYVIFLSAKETAFDPFQQREKLFSLRDFSTSYQQRQQILVHAGLVEPSDLDELSEDSVDAMIDDLVEHFSGLIVIDDIDALTRRNQDTGEETLFLKAAQSGGRTKILYTLRYAPPYAVNTSQEVPVLDFATEFYPFTEACAAQFGVNPPSSTAAVRLFQDSGSLPLIIETIVGLRRTCSSYEEAIESYKEREGDAARKYLYQREYDRLDGKGKSRQLLAALALIEAPVSFTTISNVTSFSTTQVHDAITETRGIFLRTVETEAGDSLYEVTNPALSFLRQTSQTLPFYPALERAVAHFKKDGRQLPPDEAALLFRLNKFAREGDYSRIVEEVRSIPPAATIRANPRFLGLLGQGYAAAGAAHSEDAREAFRRSFALHNRDQYMLRAWYKLEYLAPHTIPNAERLCRDVLATKDLAPRLRSEFNSKLGQTLAAQARPHSFTNRDRAIQLMTQAIEAYVEGAWLSRSNSSTSTQQSEWITGAAGQFFRLLGNDVEPLFLVLETIASDKHDVDLDSARILAEPLKRLVASVEGSERARLGGLARRTLAKVHRVRKSLAALPGHTYVRNILEEVGRQASQ